MLDRLKKLKSKALGLTIEGIIMHQRNKTKINCYQMHWKKSWLQQENQKKMQKEQYRKRMAEIQKVLVQKMENKEKKKQEKERQMLTEREQLANQINEYGGLWSKEVVWKNINELRSEADKRLALEIQLNF